MDDRQAQQIPPISPPTRHIIHRLALPLVATALLLFGVLLPFSIADILADVLSPAESSLYRIPGEPEPVQPAPTHSRLHLAIVGINEIQGTATVRVSGHHLCQPGCNWSDQVVFASLPAASPEAEGLPPAVAVTLPPTALAVNQTFDLPLSGHPVRYPFDDYHLTLALFLQRVLPDGTVQVLTRVEATGHLFLTLQSQVPRYTMDPPVPIPPETVRQLGVPVEYLSVDGLTFRRPPYLRVLSVLLVLLITLIAAYAIFLRPFEQLITNASLIILGMWGVRAILTPSTQTYLSALDFSLSLAILFLLFAVAVRALGYHLVHSQLARVSRSRSKTSDAG